MKRTIPTGMRQTIIVSNSFPPLYLWSSKKGTLTVVTVTSMRIISAEQDINFKSLYDQQNNL